MQKAYQIVSDQLKSRSTAPNGNMIKEFELFTFCSTPMFGFIVHVSLLAEDEFKKLTDGPYRIVRVLNDVNYVIQKVPGGRRGPATSV